MALENGVFKSLEKGTFFGLAVRHPKNDNNFHAVEALRFFYIFLISNDVDITEKFDLTKCEGKIAKLTKMHESTDYYSTASGTIFRMEENCGLFKQTRIFTNASQGESATGIVKSYCDLDNFVESLRRLILSHESLGHDILPSKKKEVTDLINAAVVKCRDLQPITPL